MRVDEEAVSIVSAFAAKNGSHRQGPDVLALCSYSEEGDRDHVTEADVRKATLL
ncbi:MAG: hypothetical protein ABSB81_07265 [Halobacteriota archaeon]